MTAIIDVNGMLKVNVENETVFCNKQHFLICAMYYNIY